VQNTLAEVGAAYKLVDNASGVRAAERLILPGVGHFGQMMRALDAMRVREVLVEKIRDGTPFLGICLGLQALFADSEEAPGERGLGIFDGTIRRFAPGLRVPHMGWNTLAITRESRLVRDGDFMYFANSYYAPVTPETSAVCEYGVPFAAVIENGSIQAVQFHPEKSGPSGLRVVRSFAEAC
jgi:imidazole glycerol phosphate synthase glutamine amidotransferase subunit